MEIARAISAGRGYQTYVVRGPPPPFADAVVTPTLDGSMVVNGTVVNSWYVKRDGPGIVPLHPNVFYTVQQNALGRGGF